VETANRFARDLIVQETGHRMLKGKGIEIIAADSPTAFVDDTPTATFVRQGSGAPSGPRNGNYRHGRHTKEAIAERQFMRALIRQSRELLQRVQAA
jgi:hypothetical protein